jgi:hypothetical protein
MAVIALAMGQLGMNDGIRPRLGRHSTHLLLAATPVPKS